ncbi:Mobile element protein [Cystobacter fuscus DSM 2262]|uniref:Mobile element protein n=1 Tax=Cystobacter fuscus (strain ATCC 25194 / DSM 2262 / NBRC 100088 / M29) TaxID=1242864 RepID=S9QIJ9_CYSF2|nr:IS3 family transposase [Cystobacter fuscus]EPX56298.1 Mobile element protein [Cystobacter fuscus DSM 2262]
MSCPGKELSDVHEVNIEEAGDRKKAGRRPRRRSSYVERIQRLERELKRTQKKLAEAEALLLLKRSGTELGRRGQWHGREERQRILLRVDGLIRTGVPLKRIGSLLGVSLRTVQRWRASREVGDRRRGVRSPVNRLSDSERERLLAILHSEEHRALSPRQLVPKMADEGLYLASESTMYRLLRAGPRWSRCAHGGDSTAPGLTPLLINAPNRAWSWDITYLKCPTRGAYLYLYLIMDVFSRRIMGWEIHEVESTQRAAAFIRRTCEANTIDPRGLILHSDNGGPMRGAITLSTLRELGIIPSYSRPHVHDDNSFSEALFRTLKNHPAFPEHPFRSPHEARAWLEWFSSWYNHQHRHSALCFVTPEERYSGQDHIILSRRRTLYECARGLHPTRWSGRIRDWFPVGPVLLGARPSLG